MMCQLGAGTWEARKGNVSYASQCVREARKAECICVPACVLAQVPKTQAAKGVLKDVESIVTMITWNNKNTSSLPT